ncbi:unnamed protein product [Caenorhabditis angaria]|uniref:RNA polymerase I-specific transcription initiation factor RRN3 n=1 Tax=Caenorhabditis angaria TaxID=860376 RepID=A0A9P1MZ81_9PELO|nr:unnamed protein product [Caenorhabditis angaria]
MKRSTDSPPSTSVAPKLAKIEEAPTGRQIISEYLKGDVNAAVTYRKICNALDTFDMWESDVPKIQLLEQFMNISDALDVQTEGLVRKLLNLNWNKIPNEIMDKYRDFLCELAIRQICFTEEVFKSVCERLIPQIEQNEETFETTLRLDDAIQNQHFEMAHYIISNILKCFPMSSKTLLRCLRQTFPHFTQPAIKSTVFCRNLIRVQIYAPNSIVQDIWQMIFERLVKDDAHNWRCELPDGEEHRNSPSLFAMNEEDLINDVETETTESTSENPKNTKKSEEMMKHLDTVCTDILDYLKYVHEPEEITEESWITSMKLENSKPVNAEQIFAILNHCLESTMLTAIHVRHISFVWLFLCSLKKEYTSRMLENLWQISCRMPRAPADAKKSQGAAAYLAAFVARAKYIDKGTAFEWLEEMYEWLRHYVDQFCSGSSQILPGLQRHGTFYAISQSFFLVFAFRYRDFVKNSDWLEKIRSWSIGRIVHSSLEPLRYVSRPVARCFSAISRSLQLVYCNHIIPIDEQLQQQRPFDDMFPFDSYHLKVSSEYVVSLMRKFSPLAEDVSILSAALSWNSATAEKSAENANSDGMDFLDNDDFVVEFRDRSGTCGQSSLINYSAAPGLKTFGAN